MPTDEPTIESLQEELRQVVNRHNELAERHDHGLIVATLQAVATELMADRPIDVEVRHHEYEGTKWASMLYDGQYADAVGLYPGEAPPDVLREALPGTVEFGTDATRILDNRGGSA